MVSFIVAINTASTKASLIKALLSCVSGGLVNVGAEFYDHRYMFQVPKRGQDLVAAFIASPYLPAKRLAIASRAGRGFCSSGIASSVVAKLLRTDLSAGLLLLISFSVL